MTHRRVGPRRRERAESLARRFELCAAHDLEAGEDWAHPSVGVLLLVSGSLWLAWWASSIVLAPFVLAGRGDRQRLPDTHLASGAT